MNGLPKTVTRQRRDCDLNPGPSAPESSTLTTRLPSHTRRSYNEDAIASTCRLAMRRTRRHLLGSMRCHAARPIDAYVRSLRPVVSRATTVCMADGLLLQDDGVRRCSSSSSSSPSSQRADQTVRLAVRHSIHCPAHHHSRLSTLCDVNSGCETRLSEPIGGSGIF